MAKGRIILWVAAALLVVAVLAVVADRYFLPEGSDRVDEDLAEPEAATVLRSGTFQGDTGHHVSGTVELIELNGTHYLRFQDYEQTSGPDVYVYLTEQGDTDDADEVEAGLRVLIDGGRDGGESTKVGNFLQRLPSDFDPARYNGVTIWCDQFNVRFGYAELTAL